jgi:hypothetical protein
MNAFLVAITLFPPGPRLAERASVQTSIKWALVVLFASVRKGAPHAHEKWEKWPFYRHLHACTLTHAQTGAEKRKTGSGQRQSSKWRLWPTN